MTTRSIDVLRGPLVVPLVLALVVVLAGWRTVEAVGGPGSYQVTATFSTAPGIYKGNAVKLLGVRVGSVVSVKPSADGVRVAIDVDEGTKLPADVKAYLMAPNVVNDRFIEFGPGYTGGPTLAADATLPVERTVVPQSVDQIVASIDRLATDLGPDGANANGSLSRLLEAVATQLGGQGTSINGSVKNLGEVFQALSEDGDDLTSLLNDLGGVTHAAAGVSGQYQRFAGDLAQVSTALADDDTAIADSIKNLAEVLARLNTFVHDNKDQLKGTLTSLSKVAAAVGGQQEALQRSLRMMPLAAQNVDKAIDPATGGVRTRYNQVRSPALTDQICGDTVLRMLVLVLDEKRDRTSPMDLACGAQGIMRDLQPGPGAPSASSFTRKALQSLGGR